MAETTYAITIEIPENGLEVFTDQHLAALWHLTQANPAPIEDPAAGRAAENVGREIIRRFLANTKPALWNHQGRHADWAKLMQHKGLLDSPANPEEQKAREAREANDGR